MRKIGHYHILLVDDEYYLRQSFIRQVEQLDSEFLVTEEAENGIQAMEILKEKDIQVIISDIRMPVMDGLELAKKVQSLYPDIQTVLLTGYADFTYAQSAIRYGVFDYLLKPVNREDLENTFSGLRMRLRKDYELPEEPQDTGMGGQESVDFAIAYMHEHYMEDIDIGALAEQLGFRSAYLTRLFNRYAGESPLKLLTNIRIHEAKRLLQETSLSISAVGERVGYPDQFHFSKTFRKATGVNPSAYRQSPGLFHE